MIDEEKHLEDNQPTVAGNSESSAPHGEDQIDAKSTIQNENASDDSGDEMTLDQVSLEDLEENEAVGDSAERLRTAEESKTTYQKAEADLASIKELGQEIETLRAQLEDRTSQYVRIAADFDNFRKRTQKEREEVEDQVKCSTIVELLPVVDNFERARSQIKPQTDAEMNIHKSYQSVYKQLVECLKRIGVAPMRAEGQEFDPNLHEAVLREQTEEHPEGTVIEELVRGYLLGERVLRHAMVKVAAAPEPVATSGEGDQSNS
ncbi:MAG: nucleotide exchange factor GrpE [Elainellaceae cyanobacterium]